MHTPVYLDNHATTPVDPRVLEAMLPCFSGVFGNPSSRVHEFGWRAAEAVETARAQVARLIGAAPDEIIFTSGATESNNLAIKGVYEAAAKHGNHIITCATEHAAVLDVCRSLEKRGALVTILPVDSGGLLDPGRVADAITDHTILISVMTANNEIGVIQPIEDIARVAAYKDIPFHTDAAQACGKAPFNVRAAGVHLVSFTAHKLYGPKGVGALCIRRRPPRVRLAAQIHGGGQERGWRSGTLNVPGIVGFGKACELMLDEMPAESLRLRVMRDRLLTLLRESIDGVDVNGALEPRLPHNLNVSFKRVEGESLIMRLRDVAVSSGSACASASVSPSHVLHALGLTPDRAHSSLRIGLGRFNTNREIDYAAGRIIEEVKHLREISPTS